MFIQQTVVAVGSAFVSVSVMVGFAAVVVPVVIVQEQVWPVPKAAVTVAAPLDCHPALRASSPLVQGVTAFTSTSKPPEVPCHIFAELAPPLQPSTPPVLVAARFLLLNRTAVVPSALRSDCAPVTSSMRFIMPGFTTAK